MATTTTNLGLTKPIGTEKALVSVINGNMDIIDNKVGAIPQNESVQSQITTLNNQINNVLSGVTLIASTSAYDFGQYNLPTGKTLADYKFISIDCVTSAGASVFSTSIPVYIAGNYHNTNTKLMNLSFGNGYNIRLKAVSNSINVDISQNGSAQSDITVNVYMY